MSKFCGLCPTSKSSDKPLQRKLSKKAKADANEPHQPTTEDLDSLSALPETTSIYINKKGADIHWARQLSWGQLSAILEVDSTKGTPNWEKTEAAALGNWEKGTRVSNFKGKTRFLEHRESEENLLFGELIHRRRMSDTMEPRAILSPSRDLETIARIDASLVFEHFTVTDAWDLGSALRNRLLPIPTPVVINIALANANQTLFHTVTHSGVMPDNEWWVARKRKTVLRWGVSTWYMGCKFGGDEEAFAEKYGLGSEAKSYAIHGGGVPIRVTGVEGVVAVVVVSGLKQDEDHAVIVEVIKDLYY